MATVRSLVHDVDACLPFYLALGFEEVERWGPPFVILQKGDLELWLSGPGTSASRPLEDGTIPQPGGWTRMVIGVSDLDGVLASLGTKVRNGPISGPGGRQALLEDPSGNLVELFEERSGNA